MNKRGGFVDLFVFMIVTFIILISCGVMIYISSETRAQLHSTMDNMEFGEANVTETIDSTFGHVYDTYQALYWLSILLIFAMIISIFIGSYMVTTKPVFFVAYLFILIIAVILAASISNAYETIRADATLGTTLSKFVGGNWIMAQLPIVICIVGFVGGIIMYSRIGSKEGEVGYYG